MEQKPSLDFTQFKARISSLASNIPRDERVYRSRWYRNRDAVRRDFTLAEINDIIRSGDPQTMRDLSRYYFRISGIYRNTVLMYANAMLFYTLVTPIYDTTRDISHTKTIARFNLACNFIDTLNVPVNFTHINLLLILNGIYFGMLRESEGRYTIQDLPLQYCRTRFKDYNDLNILEFNVQYFDTIPEEAVRAKAISTYPAVVRAHYRKFHSSVVNDPWIAITPDDGGMAFIFGDGTPLFISSIPDIYTMNEAVDREAKRDEDELHKLLIHQMPVDKNGELVFDLNEVADIHASIAEMLKDMDTVNVMTTFGDAKLENLQDSTAATQSASRIEKYYKNSYDNMGVSSLLFNATGSGSIPYALKKDEGILFSIAALYDAWLKNQLNKRFGNKTLRFDFTTLPITVFNRAEEQTMYFKAAQYGMPKYYAAVASGIKQTNLMSLAHFENSLLNITEALVPLQSSYTSSGKTGTKNGNESGSNSEGGRPVLSDEQKSEKTQANIAAAD